MDLPDGRLGIIKDSWITTDRPVEANFLDGLDIPFGPQLINHCVLGNTCTFRDNPIRPPAICERREKRRVVTYPAGVHISDFSSLWELMAAMLDVVIGMAYSQFPFYCSSDFFFRYTLAIMFLDSKQKLHRDISYTNILLREREANSTVNAVRKQFIEDLGLSEIEKLREELNCREGLLIDFDYATTTPDATNQVERDSEDCEGGSGERVVLEGADAASTSSSNSCHAPEPSGVRTVWFFLTLRPFLRFL